LRALTGGGADPIERRNRLQEGGRSWTESAGERAKATGTREELDGREEKERGGYTGNRRRRPGRSSGGGHENRKIGSDTMLGIDKLYSLGAKGHNI
jgi:hypothetical protein